MEVTLKFNNDLELKPRDNQRVIIWVGSSSLFYKNWISKLKYTTAIYMFNEKKGEYEYVLDAGGVFIDFIVYWAEIPADLKMQKRGVRHGVEVL